MARYLILMVFLCQTLLAREILIGDRIDLEIEGTGIEEAADAFRKFEVEEITEEDGGVRAAFRIYETGVQRTKIGGVPLDIIVKSSLEKGESEIKRDLSGESLLIYRREVLPWMFFAGIAGITASAGGWIWMLRRRRGTEEKTETPRERFYRVLIQEEDDYPGEVSAAFRGYYDSLTGRNTLSGDYKSLGEAGGFLSELDHMKFSGGEGMTRDEAVRRAGDLMRGIEEEVGRDA